MESKSLPALLYNLPSESKEFVFPDEWVTLSVVIMEI